MKKETILIVDDVESNRLILRDLFEDTYDILEAGNGKEALEQLISNYRSLSIVLLDIVMPVMDGIKVLEMLSKKKILEQIPVILITGEESKELEKQGYDYGVMDFIRKPFDEYITIKRVNNIVELFRHKRHLEKMVKEQTVALEKQGQLLQKQNELLKLQNQQMNDLNIAIIESMSSVVEFRNLESGQHIKRIKGFTKCLAKCVAEKYPEYGLTEEKIEIITEASAMHDIGKIAIPDSILLKPSRLTDDEFEVIKSHTTKGCELISTIAMLQGKEYFDYSYEICRHHHERYDGKGYPDGLKGEEIPIAAQIVSIADVYDALTSERIYKRAYSVEQAYFMIIKGECGVFSPKMTECLEIVRPQFEQLAEKYQDMIVETESTPSEEK